MQNGIQHLASGRYKYILIAVLVLTFAYVRVEGIALGLALQDIKHDLHASDTELGLLTGIAFALFGALAGMPLARWADRGNRVTIIALTTVLLSVFMFLCGLAASFLQLLLFRVGVAVGETGCVPPANSLIPDHFSREERPRAAALFFSGPAVSTMAVSVVTGWLIQLYGWRETFMILAAPGLLIALLAVLTLKEPRLLLHSQHARDQEHSLAGTGPGDFWQDCAILFKIPTYVQLLSGLTVATIFGNAIGIWSASYFMRTLHVGTGVLGMGSSVLGACGAIGLYAGGEVATRYLPNKEGMQTRTLAVSYVGAAIAYTFVFLAGNYLVALSLMAVATFGGSLTGGPVFAAIQSLVPERLRAMSIALMGLFGSLIGGCGPLAVGVLSDFFHPWLGGESLRYALLIFCPGYLWASWHLWSASKTILRDLETARIQALSSDSTETIVAGSLA